MSDEYTLVTAPAADPVIAGDATQVVLEFRCPQSGPDGQQVVERWVGARDPVLAMYEDYYGENGLESIGIQERPAGQLALNIVWNAPWSGTIFNPGDADPEWNVRPIRVTPPLATHPYWQVAYVAGTGEFIEERMAEAEHAIETGAAYAYDAGGTYDEWVDRYHALRMAGVEHYTLYGVSLAKQIRTTKASDLRDYAPKINIVAATLNDIAGGAPPAWVRDYPNAIRRIHSYISGASPLVDNIQFEVGKWEFLQLPPEIRGPKDGPWTLSVEWHGLDRWSRVLYPGGSWDPPDA